MVVNRGRFFLQMIMKSLRFSFTQSAVIFVAVALGACVSGAFINVYLDIDSKMRKELKAYGANFIFAPLVQKEEFSFSEELYHKLKAQIEPAKLMGATPYLYGLVRLSLGEALIAGVDFAGMKETKPFLEVVHGSYINVDFDERNALAGIDLAKKMELKVGSVVDLVNEKSGFATSVRIKGIVSSGDKEDGLLFVSLPLAQKALGREGEVHLAEAVILGDFRELGELGERLREEGVLAKPLARISLSEGIVLEKIKLLMALVAFTVLLITSMCVNTTLSSIIFARTKEIALLRAIGASRAEVVKLFGSETLIMTLSASLAGALLGILLAQWLGLAIFGSGIDFRFLSIPLAIGISLLFAALAAYYPIKRTLHLGVANILRGE